MPNIWFISDTHFNHDNILKFKGADNKPIRPFKSLHDMNETIIENWNRKVRPGDKVYHLGDVFFGNKEEFKKLWPRLNGKKRLVVGNHDDIKFLSHGGFFSKVLMWRIFKDLGIICTHVPINQESFRAADINLHGHTHEKGSPNGPYVSCCVEVTGYRPLHIDEVRK